MMLSVGSASADSYNQRTDQVGPTGASASYVLSGTTANGDAYYHQVQNSAGPEGTTSTSTNSTTADQAQPSGIAGLLQNLFG
ncbi:hypothetical protein [Streptomyces naganishii]|uniref:hypothetical protein n=1 Tax=Streptomyces naganishii TaxID=285447 RepID=UPI00167E8D51|nr:hypothetical protein [Streptomyces naganishii]